jgi:Bacterial type III secretion protein (HrpB1_HrpK)
MQQDLDESATFSLLLRTGVLCTRTQLMDEALTILNATSLYRPERTDVKLAMALHFFTARRYFDAIDLLEGKILRDQPGFAPALGLLAMVLRAINRPGWQDLLKTIIENESDGQLVAMAREMLNEPPVQITTGIQNNGIDEFVFPGRC